MQKILLTIPFLHLSFRILYRWFVFSVDATNKPCNDLIIRDVYFDMALSHGQTIFLIMNMIHRTTDVRY